MMVPIIGWTSLASGRMKTMNRTPGKWDVEGRYFDYGKEWWIVDEFGHNVLGPISCPKNCIGPEIIYDIVRAVNCHERLVESLEDLVAIYKGEYPNHTMTPKYTALLAEARGGAKMRNDIPHLRRETEKAMRRFNNAWFNLAGIGTNGNRSGTIEDVYKAAKDLEYIASRLHDEVDKAWHLHCCREEWVQAND